MIELELLEQERSAAEVKAWESLSGYKFMMFGYWSAVWVHLNQVISKLPGGLRLKNPWSELVSIARSVIEF